MFGAFASCTKPLATNPVAVILAVPSSCASCCMEQYRFPSATRVPQRRHFVFLGIYISQSAQLAFHHPRKQSPSRYFRICSGWSTQAVCVYFCHSPSNHKIFLCSWAFHNPCSTTELAIKWEISQNFGCLASRVHAVLAYPIFAKVIALRRKHLTTPLAWEMYWLT